MKLSQKTWIALGAAAGLLCLTCAGGLITIGLQLRRVVSRQAPARSSEPSSGGGETKPTTTTKADQTLIKLYIKQIASTRIQTNDSLPSETGYAIDALGEIGPDAKEAIPTLANFIRQRQRFDFGGSDCARTVRSLRWMGAFDTLESLMFDGSVKKY